MNCIVTAGPTYESLDEVRRLTNFSTGRLGTELANFLTARGHAVTLLIGEVATWPGVRQAKTVKVFSSTRDLAARLKACGRQPPHAIFHAAAVSDFTFGKMFTREANGRITPLTPTRKIATRNGRLLVELVPTPKILSQLRGWFPQACLIGWKFEADGRRTDAVDAARKQLAAAGTDACVANGPAYGSGFGLVTAQTRRHFADCDRLFFALEKLAGSR
jgi:phosphopantothenoylcysteine decarboxylase/phosphopantothenate--cysteine ligase